MGTRPQQLRGCNWGPALAEVSWEEVSDSSGLVCRGGSCGFIIAGTKRKEQKQHALQGLLPKEPEFPAFPWGVCAQPDPQPHALLPAHPSPSHPH